MAEGIEGVPREVGEGFTRKLGPLPVWGWITIAGVGVVGFLYLKGRAKGGSPWSALQNLPAAAPLGGGFDGGGGGGGTTNAPPTTATAAQIQDALNKAASATGIVYSEGLRYWQEYLAGNAPVGSTQATGAYNSFINSMLGLLGTSAPTPAASTGGNFYTSMNAWLSDIFGVIQPPAGSKLTLSQIENELSQFYAGTITSVSQDTLTALQNAIGIYGLGPGATIPGVTTTTTTTTPPAGITIPSVADLSAWWHAASWWTTANPAASFVSDLQGFISGLTNTQAWQIWNFTQANPSYFLGPADYVGNLRQVISDVVAGRAPTTGNLTPAPRKVAPSGTP